MLRLSGSAKACNRFIVMTWYIYVSLADADSQHSTGITTGQYSFYFIFKILKIYID